MKTEPVSSSALLHVENLSVGYGELEVVHRVSLSIRAHALCALVGPNGAGKTTLLLALSKVLTPRSGRIFLDGNDVTALRPHQLIARGLIHVPEGRHILSSMTVAENLLVAADRGRIEHVQRAIDDIYERFPILKARRSTLGGALSGGEQQLLAIARALMLSPRILLLDEPSMGLAPKLVKHIFEIIVQESERGTAILLVEQNARAALAIADDAYVFERGTVALSGPAAEIRTHPEVMNAYLRKT